MKKRIQVNINGAVQGIGFRPFIYRLANELNLSGFVSNSTSGALIEAEGEEKVLDILIERIKNEKPKLAVISGIDVRTTTTNGNDKFEIRRSDDKGLINTLVIPDIAVCHNCIEELFNPKDRRYLYPFINCTNCGPRYSIIERIPYDRCNTSMKSFKMCDECKSEYTDPSNRRFHAQPIACPKCGPQIELKSNLNKVIAVKNDAISHAVDILNDGKIIALKGLGGFQLLVDARNSAAVIKLRKRKHRSKKPFALMFPSIKSVREICYLSTLEESLLLSTEAPIVLLKRKSHNYISSEISPSNPYLGVMLPYTPLHHLLMKEVDYPVIATSGNISEEPICIENDEAISKMKRIADYFLINNRPIVRPVDDSIVRVVDEKPMILRRARGYSPLPVKLNNHSESKKVILAVGGHLKNSIAVKKDNSVFISQHIGDLTNMEAINNFHKTIDDYKILLRLNYDEIISDLHPDYSSSRFAESIKLNNHKVQHHIAHIASCIAENNIKGNCLGVSWDGTGLGFDNSIWGSEFFYVDNDFNYKHIAQFKPFILPGGDSAAKDTRRAAIGLLYEMYQDKLHELNFDFFNKFQKHELNNILTMLKKNINCYKTTSVGRLFDAVSSLLNICDYSSYEGEAAMSLEFVIDETESGTYPFDIIPSIPAQIDWRKMITAILDDIKNKKPNGIISARFHNTLVEIINSIIEKQCVKQAVLSGGCFQNKYLLEKTIIKLRQSGVSVFWNKEVPINDGGISFGQIAYNEMFNQKEITRI